MRYSYYVLGLSKLGSGIAQQLATDGNDVVVIDKNKSSFLKLSPSFPGYKIEGDLSDISFLESSGIKNCDRVVIVTDSDNLNIMLTHICHKIFNIKQIYVRLDRIDKETLFHNMEGVNIINAFQLSLDYFESLIGEQV